MMYGLQKTSLLIGYTPLKPLIIALGGLKAVLLCHSATVSGRPNLRTVNRSGVRGRNRLGFAALLPHRNRGDFRRDGPLRKSAHRNFAYRRSVFIGSPEMMTIAWACGKSSVIVKSMRAS